MERKIVRRPTGRRKYKYSRSRAGCFTCRHRRVKCDEAKPICIRCKKGNRECVYPSACQREERNSEPSTSKVSEHDETQQHLSESEDEVEDFDIEEISEPMITEPVVVPVFETPGSQLIYTSQVPFTQETIFNPFSFEKEELIVSPYFQTYRQLELIYSNPLVPRHPKSVLDNLSLFYLQYHSERIISAHLFRTDCNNALCKVWLPAMSEDFPSLQHALIAFSALIYWLKTRDVRAQRSAFVHYSISLKELRKLVDSFSYLQTQYHAIVATSLQLACLDRHFGDSNKCFRHTENIASFMQKCSNPAFQSSTVLGRALVEWYLNFENYVCLLYPAKRFLPKIWRQENHGYYERLAPNQESFSILEPQVQLEKLWAEYNTILGKYLDLHASLARLPTIPQPEKSSYAKSLLKRWKTLYTRFDNFRTFFERLEIFQPDRDRALLPSVHPDCCPPAPFVPYFAKYPPAGILRQVVLGVQIHFRLIMFAPLRPYDVRMENSRVDETGWLAYELCRTFAGLEESLAYNSDELIPTYAALTMAGFGCRRMDIRLWLWRKLAHYEELSVLGYHPMKERLAVFWGMPQLLSMKFEAWKSNPPEQERVVLSEEFEKAIEDGKTSLESDAGSPEYLEGEIEADEEEDDF